MLWPEEMSRVNAEATERGCSTFHEDTGWRHVRLKANGRGLNQL